MAVTLESLGIDRLTVHEKLDLIELLWDSLPPELSPEEIPAWHIPILEQRLAAIRANSGKGRPWEEVMGEIEGKP